MSADVELKSLRIALRRLSKSIRRESPIIARMLDDILDHDIITDGPYPNHDKDDN